MPFFLFPFHFTLWCGFYMVFLFLVADVEVKEDGVFICLRKETFVCEDKDSSKRVSFSGVPKPMVGEVPECSGSEAAVSLEAIPEDLTFDSGEAFSLEGVDNIPMEEYFAVAVAMGRRLGLVILLAYHLILC